jgi:hypothetical protein
MQIGILQRIGEEIRNELRTLTLRVDNAFVPVCGKKGGPAHPLTSFSQMRLRLAPPGRYLVRFYRSNFAWTIRLLCRRWPVH